MIRFRRDIREAGYAVYQEETWEPVEHIFRGSTAQGLRFVDSKPDVYYEPLKDYEFKALQDGWLPPVDFTYVNKLPATAGRMLP